MTAFIDVYPYTEVANQNANRVESTKRARIRYFFRLWILQKETIISRVYLLQKGNERKRDVWRDE